MNVNKHKTRLLFVLLGAMGALVLSWAVYMYSRPLVMRVDNSRRGRANLERLLKKNEIDLPQGFYLDANDPRIRVTNYDHCDSQGTWYRCVRMKYPSSGWDASYRGLSFVFNISGKCLYWGFDDTYLSLGGFFDITRSGITEKAYAYYHIEGKSRNEYIKGLKIVRIIEDKAFVILHIEYSPVSMADPTLYSEHLEYDENENTWKIVLIRSYREDDIIALSWSKHENRFIITKGSINDEWTIISNGLQ